MLEFLSAKDNYLGTVNVQGLDGAFACLAYLNDSSFHVRLRLNEEVLKFGELNSKILDVRISSKHYLILSYEVTGLAKSLSHNGNIFEYTLRVLSAIEPTSAYKGKVKKVHLKIDSRIGEYLIEPNKTYCVDNLYDRVDSVSRWNLKSSSTKNLFVYRRQYAPDHEGKSPDDFWGLSVELDKEKSVEKLFQEINGVMLFLNTLLFYRVGFFEIVGDDQLINSAYYYKLQSSKEYNMPGPLLLDNFNVLVTGKSLANAYEVYEKAARNQPDVYPILEDTIVNQLSAPAKFLLLYQSVYALCFFALKLTTEPKRDKNKFLIEWVYDYVRTYKSIVRSYWPGKLSPIKARNRLWVYRNYINHLNDRKKRQKYKPEHLPELNYYLRSFCSLMILKAYGIIS